MDEESTLLKISVIGLGHRRENRVPHADLPPSDKTIVASRRRPVALGSIGPRRTRPQPPIDAVERALRSSARATPRGLFGSNCAMIDHSKSVSSYRRALIKLPFGQLESHRARKRNPFYEFVTWTE